MTVQVRPMSDCQDHDAFTRQLVAVQRRLYAYILTLLPNLVDADDVLQETNAALLRSREQFTPGTDFGAWACKVAYFQLLTLRKRRQRERGRLLFADDELLQSLAGEASQQWGSREAAMLARLEGCMSEIGLSHRELLKLRYHDNLSSKQIAANTGHSDDAVRRTLYRIRTQLLACLQREARKEDGP
jgi:RNA polymerase sigma-70 factor, ECF subfamily